MEGVDVQDPLWDGRKPYLGLSVVGVGVGWGCIGINFGFVGGAGMGWGVHVVG